MRMNRRTMLTASAAAAAATQAPAIAAKGERAETTKIDDTAQRIVTLEEHFHVRSLVADHPKARAAWMPEPLSAKLDDLSEGRLRDMDEAGITVQVLSASAGAELLDGAEGVGFAKRTNDRLAAAVRQHPQRFAGFAHLPMRTPEAAADELERCVKQMGFRGALIHGLTDGRFLDDPRFEPILARAEALDVPIYIHPNFPPKAVYDAYYAGLPGNGSMALVGGVFGWHSEVGIHVLRLALAGTFDKHPRLKVIIGHMGEMLPFMLDRADDMMANMLPNVLGRTDFPMKSTPDEGPISHILLNHVYITTSGVFSTAAFSCALATFGADRIMFSVDYPLSGAMQARRWLDTLALSPADKHKIRYGNADRLLKLSPA